MLNQTWEIKEYFNDNHEAWSNGSILGQHCAKLALLEHNETLNIMGIEYKRIKSASIDRQWDEFYVKVANEGIVTDWLWVGNVWGAIEHYTANFTNEHWDKQ